MVFFYDFPMRNGVFQTNRFRDILHGLPKNVTPHSFNYFSFNGFRTKSVGMGAQAAYSPIGFKLKRLQKPSKLYRFRVIR